MINSTSVGRKPSGEVYGTGKEWYNPDDGGRQNMLRKWTAAGCVLWIAGLAAFLVGLNLQGDTGKWLQIIGNIVFLAGLGITGAAWFYRRRTARGNAEKEDSSGQS